MLRHVLTRSSTCNKPQNFRTFSKAAAKSAAAAARKLSLNKEKKDPVESKKKRDEYASVFRGISLDFNPKAGVEEALEDTNVGFVKAQRGKIVTIEEMHCPVGGIVNFNQGQDADSKGIVLTLDEEHTYVSCFGNKLPPAYATVQVDNVALFAPAADTTGRTLNALGETIGEGDEIDQTKGFIDVFKQPVPSIAERAPIREMIQTGIKFLDLFKPLARGHRMALVGPDNARGHEICLDILGFQASLNKSRDVAEQMHFVYVIIGRTERYAEEVKATLADKDALEYTTLIVASSKDGLASQLCAPFTGSAIAGKMRDDGKHVIIVYDDLGRHGHNYMENAELVNEAKTASYLHAQLLERAAQLSPEKGGGSLTALCMFSCEDPKGEIIVSGRSNVRLMSSLVSMTDSALILDGFLAATRHFPPLKVGDNLPLHPTRFQPKITCAPGQYLSNLLVQSRLLRRDQTVAEQLGFEIEEQELPYIEYEDKLEKFFKQKQGTSYQLREQLISLHAAGRELLFRHIAKQDLARYESGLYAWIQVKAPGLWEELGTLQFSDVISADCVARLQKEIHRYEKDAFE